MRTDDGLHNPEDDDGVDDRRRIDDDDDDDDGSDDDDDDDRVARMIPGRGRGRGPTLARGRGRRHLAAAAVFRWRRPGRGVRSAVGYCAAVASSCGGRPATCNRAGFVRGSDESHLRAPCMRPDAPLSRGTQVLKIVRVVRDAATKLEQSTPAASPLVLYCFTSASAASRGEVSCSTSSGRRSPRPWSRPPSPS